MHRDALRALLRAVARGEVDPGDAVERLAHLPFVAERDVLADTHRSVRSADGEAVYCAGKTPEQAAAAFSALARGGGPVLATRASDAHAAAILATVEGARHVADARMVVLDGPVERCGRVAVVCAGTSDLPVASEAAVTAEVLGGAVERVWDVGVAGLHRLLAHLELLRGVGVIVAVAGMEGALPSVLGGLVAVPVVAVPTSVGYGAAFQGLAALLAMLNCCAPGVAVVNIDNGFGAGVLATRILRSGGRTV